MKFLIVLALIAMAIARPEDGFYDSKYDSFNADELIGNTRLLKSYAHCFIGDGKCTPEGGEISKLIPEASTSSCAKCTEKQKVIVAKTIKALKEQLPEEYAALTGKVDPEGKHAANLQQFVDKHSA